ncbi:MAG: polyhydroxyalkanoic acid system family protein [Rubrivivax sp.]
MADIHIQRSHSLGFPKARKVAWQWAEEVEAKFDMECTVIEGESCDTVEFKRTGVKGTLLVAADGFELKAQLGFLLGAFSRTIESEIEKNLDDLLASSGAAAKPAKRTAPAAAKAPTKAAKASRPAKPTSPVKGPARK